MRIAREYVVFVYSGSDFDKWVTVTVTFTLIVTDA